MDGLYLRTVVSVPLSWGRYPANEMNVPLGAVSSNTPLTSGMINPPEELMDLIAVSHPLPLGLTPITADVDTP